MKSNKLVLTCLVLVLIVVISEAGNVMKKQSRPSRPRTRTGQRRESVSRSNPDGHKLVRTDGIRRKPAESPIRSPSPGRSSSSGSRPHSSSTSSTQNSQPRFPRRKIPKIVITPPEDERPKTATKPGQKKVTFSDPMENIKYIEPNPVRRRPSGGSLRTSG